MRYHWLSAGLKAEYAWLYLVILAQTSVGPIYGTLRKRYLNVDDAYNDRNGLTIGSQLEWVNIMLEIIQETLLPPLWFCLGKIKNDDRELFRRFKSGFLVVLVIFGSSVAIVGIFASPLVEFMHVSNGNDTNSTIHEDTVKYIRYQCPALLINQLVQFCKIFCVLKAWSNFLYAPLVVQLVTTILFDLFLISSFEFSLQLGVDGVALCDIIVNTILLAIFSLYIVYRLRATAPLTVERSSFAWLRDWIGNVGIWTGVESFVRNTFYLLGLRRPMNDIDQAGLYWVTWGFLWDWLLLPFFPLAEVLKKFTADRLGPQDEGGSMRFDKRQLRINDFVIFALLSGLIYAAWLLLIPLYPAILTALYSLKDSDMDVAMSMLNCFVGFFGVFMATTLIQNVVLTIGKTPMLAFKTIAANMTIYFPFVVLLGLGKITVESTYDILLRQGESMLMSLAILLVYVYFVWIANPLNDRRTLSKSLVGSINFIADVGEPNNDQE